MEKLAADLEQMDISAEERDLIETTIFADSVQLPIDPEGRILLPKDMLDHAGIVEEARFVGKSKIFQIWEPSAYEARSTQARAAGAAAGISLSSITTLTRRPAAAAPAKE